MAPTPIIENITTFNCNPIGSFASGRRAGAIYSRLGEIKSISAVTTAICDATLIIGMRSTTPRRAYLSPASYCLRNSYTYINCNCNCNAAAAYITMEVSYQRQENNAAFFCRYSECCSKLRFGGAQRCLKAPPPGYSYNGRRHAVIRRVYVDGSDVPNHGSGASQVEFSSLRQF